MLQLHTMCWVFYETITILTGKISLVNTLIKKKEKFQFPVFEAEIKILNYGINKLVDFIGHFSQVHFFGNWCKNEL